MKTNAELTAEYFGIIDSLDGDVESRRHAHDYMKSSTAIVHHQVVDSTFVPRLFNQATYDAMKRVSETAHRILVKVIERYLADPSYREVFDFDERLVDLILIPRRYDAVLPFARVDTFLNEDDYTAKFCEFNGDGSSGMNENREITVSVAGTESFRRFVAAGHRIESCELFHAWIDDFIAIYATFENRVEKSRFAIVDYLENGVVDEFKLFARMFTQKGYPCVVADVRELSFDGSALRDKDGNRIDAIWRRCVTNDVMDHWDESQQMIDAVRAGKVALIGSFAGHIVHDKQIFSALYDPRTEAFLTPEEIAFVRETVPRTAFLDDAHIDLAEVRANKDAWIIKPTDAYGARDVYAGCAKTQAEWDDLVDRFANGEAGHPFLVQNSIQPYKTDTLPPDTGIDGLADDEVSSEPARYNNLNGLYLYNGRFQGVFSRLGPLPTISKDMKGITAATIWVDCVTAEDEEEAENCAAASPFPPAGVTGQVVIDPYGCGAN